MKEINKNIIICDSFEDKIEEAYWVFDDNKKNKLKGYTERDCFKWALREIFKVSKVEANQ